MERIQDKANEKRYNRMIEKKEEELAEVRVKTKEYENLETTIKNRRSELKTSIDLLDEIVTARNISEAHLRMLIDKITITEKDGPLDIAFQIKADFKPHSHILAS